MDPAQSAPSIETHAAPPPPPPVVVPDVPSSTPMPPPPPVPNIVNEPGGKKGKGKIAIIGSAIVAVLLVAGLAVGSLLNSRSTPTRIDSQAAGESPILTGNQCSGSESGVSCSGPFVYKFTCNGRVGECRNGGSAPSSSQSANNDNTPCNTTVQLDVFPNSCGNPATTWTCEEGTPTSSFAIWYSGACPASEPTPTPTTTQQGSLISATCNEGISGSGLPSNVSSVHLYFDSGPEDYTSSGGDGHAAVKVVAVSNGSFNYSLADASNVSIAKEVGGNLNLADGQSHRVRAFAINGSSNPELVGSNMQFTLQSRILGRIWSSNQSFQADPNKQLTKCPGCSYSLPVCNDAVTLDKTITIDGTNVQRVNQCNTGGPNYDVDLAVSSHTVTLSTGTNESVGWDCSSDNGVGCPAASGTGYTVTTTATACAPVHISFYVAGVPTPTPTSPQDPTPTPTPTFTPLAQCQQIIVQQILRNGTAVVSPTLAKIRKGDQVTFRGYASAQGTTISAIRFSYIFGVNPVVHTDRPVTLQGTQYYADLTQEITQAASYQLSISPVSP